MSMLFCVLNLLFEIVIRTSFFLGYYHRAPHLCISIGLFLLAWTVFECDYGIIVLLIFGYFGVRFSSRFHFFRGGCLGRGGHEEGRCGHDKYAGVSLVRHSTHVAKIIPTLRSLICNWPSILTFASLFWAFNRISHRWLQSAISFANNVSKSETAIAIFGHGVRLLIVITILRLFLWFFRLILSCCRRSLG